jgi:hypothetical protein
VKDIQQNILKVVSYFDIFHYPITVDEIKYFLNLPINAPLFNDAIELLLLEKMIFKIDDFYSLQNDRFLIERRFKGNKLAAKQMINASRAAKILSHFPYIRALAISGSLSKNFADEKTDIDFFIITSANRLWIARTIMHLFKKLSFLVGKQDWFCMNYYIDEAAMEISEKNIFTAMEIITLIPMYGSETIDHFFKSNEWTENYFPGKRYHFQNTIPLKKRFFKRMIEKIVDNNVGDLIDDWLMKITEKRWNKKADQKRVNERGIYMGMKVDKHFSKPDPKNFQNKVLLQYESKMKQVSLVKKITSETILDLTPSFEMK